MRNNFFCRERQDFYTITRGVAKRVEEGAMDKNMATEWRGGTRALVLWRDRTFTCTVMTALGCRFGM